MPRTLTFGQSRDFVFVATFLRAEGGIEGAEDVDTLSAHDLVRVEGSVLLSVHSIVLLSDEVVDAVFMIWSFLLDGLIQVGEGTAFSISYPDLDYPIAIEEVEPRAAMRHLRITVGRGDACATAVAPWGEFYQALGNGAQAFLTQMERLAPRFETDYTEMREQLVAVRTHAGESDARFRVKTAARR